MAVINETSSGNLVTSDADFVTSSGTNYSGSDPIATNITDSNLNESYIGVGIYLTIVGVLAIVGNISVLVVIISDKNLRNKPHNLLLVSLACSDLLVLLGGYPLTIISGYSKKWLFGHIGCVFAGFFTFFLSMTSMNTLVAVCVFRYIMICAPGKAFILTKKFTGIVILINWGCGFFWTVLPLLGWGEYGPEPIDISCSLDWANTEYDSLTYFVATIITCYIIHVTIMVCCYRGISKTVAGIAARDRFRQRQVVSQEDMLHRTKVADDQQVTRMCFLIVLVFVGVWTPYTVVCAIYIFYQDLPFIVLALPTMCAKAGCMLNPLVYFVTNRAFRLRVLRMFGVIKNDNIVGVDIPRSATRHFDQMSKEGIYLGQESMVVEQTVTMF